MLDRPVAALQPGRYAGRVIARRTVRGGITLTETLYRPLARIPAHEHLHPYLCLVRSGGYEEQFGLRSRVCGPSTVAFHPAGERHSETFGARPTRSFNVEFAPAWLEKHDLRQDLLGELEACSGAAALARMMHHEFLDGDAASALAIEGLALQLLAASVRGSRRSASAAAGAPWIARVRERIHDLSRDVPGLEELGRIAGVHPVYLARAFRESQGVTVGEYSRRVRLDAVMGELSGVATDAPPLKAVAAIAGFASQSHFTKWFRRLTGVTPSEFRSRQRV